MPIAYCTECDWRRRADDGATDELDRAMIDHYVETGHSPIERADCEAYVHALEDGPNRGSGAVRVDRGSEPESESE